MNNFTCKLKIEDRSYGLRKMPPMVGGPFAIKVLGLVAPVGHNKSIIETLKSLGGTTDKVADPNDIKMEMGDAVKMGMSILSIFEGIDINLLNILIKEALSYDVFAGDERLSDEISFDNHFQKYPQDYLPVAFWAVVMNVKDFFYKIGGGAQAVMKSLKTLPDQAQK